MCSCLEKELSFPLTKSPFKAVVIKQQVISRCCWWRDLEFHFWSHCFCFYTMMRKQHVAFWFLLQYDLNTEVGVQNCGLCTEQTRAFIHPLSTRSVSLLGGRYCAVHLGCRDQQEQLVWALSLWGDSCESDNHRSKYITSNGNKSFDKRHVVVRQHIVRRGKFKLRSEDCVGGIQGRGTSAKGKKKGRHTECYRPKGVWETEGPVLPDGKSFIGFWPCSWTWLCFGFLIWKMKVLILSVYYDE